MPFLVRMNAITANIVLGLLAEKKGPSDVEIE
jgi:hypothetical protein